MRGREFTMKDRYSFHADYTDLQREYRNMYDTYMRIFTRLGLKFRAVAADPGLNRGTSSHEFHVLAESGEDAIAVLPAVRLRSERRPRRGSGAEDRAKSAAAEMKKVSTPGKTRCEDVAERLRADSENGESDRVVREQAQTEHRGVRNAARSRRPRSERDQDPEGDRQFSGFAKDEEIERILKCRPGYIGPSAARHRSCTPIAR